MKPAGGRSTERNGSTRRSLLKGGLVAGGVGAATAAGATTAAGYHLPGQPPAPLDFDGYLNVKHFNAKGDGSQDDRAAIQACINAAAPAPATPLSDRKAVYLPPGLYHLGGPLILRDKTVLVGHGHLTVLLRRASGGHLLVNENLTAGNDDVVIDNLTLDGNRASGFSGPNLIRIQGSSGTCERIVVRRVHARDHGTGFAILFSGVVNGRIEDCQVRTCQSAGISIQNRCVDLVVQRNLVEENLGDQIATTGATPPARVSFVGNVCRGFTATGGSAIAIRSGRDIAVVGNVCSGGYAAGIELQAASANVEDVLVADNVVFEPGNVPQALIDGSPGWGIGMQVAASNAGRKVTRVQIRDNVIVSPRYHGVSLDVPTNISGAAITDVGISGNQIFVDRSAAYVQGQGAGIASVQPYAEVSNVRILDNDVRDTFESGIKVRGRDGVVPKRWDIRSNRIVGAGATGKPGIHVETVEGVTVAGNRAANLADWGLRLSGASGDVMIEGNAFAEGTAGTILVSNSTGARSLRIRDNSGFSPWTGDVDLPAAGWSASAPFTQDVIVRFDEGGRVPFPTARPPQVLCTARSVGTENLNAYAVAMSVSNTQFTLRAVAETRPLFDHKAAWIAEPFD